jgi:hypothetical protein
MIKLFALLALSFVGYEALSDPFPVKDPLAPKPFGQMRKQEELVDQTKTVDKLLSRNVVGTLGQNFLLKMLFKNLIIITLIKSHHNLVACNIRQQLLQQGQRHLSVDGHGIGATA